MLMKMVGYYPSVLSDLGFLSNEDEAIYYQELQSYQALGLATLKSLIKNLDGDARYRNWNTQGNWRDNFGTI